jgi:hypothetical protein
LLYPSIIFPIMDTCENLWFVRFAMALPEKKNQFKKPGLAKKTKLLVAQCATQDATIDLSSRTSSFPSDVTCFCCIKKY